MQRNHFEILAHSLCTLDGLPEGLDRVSLSLAAEDTDFIRFNQSLVRQATQVAQTYVTLCVVAGRRRSDSTLTLCGDLARDQALLLAERARLVAELPGVPEDEYLCLAPRAAPHTHDDDGSLPEPAQLIEAVAARAQGTDFVGIYTAGRVLRAYADSLGQRHWHRAASFDLDWCLYHAADKAVKTRYAGSRWTEAQWAHRMDEARERLSLLARPVRHLVPGEYRVYLSPTAVAGFLSMMSWGGFGLKDVRTGVSSLQALHEGRAALHAGVTLTEELAAGLAPAFSADGFVKPTRTELIRQGRAVGTLVSPRTAVEYGVNATGAGADESPESLAMAGGELPEAEVLQALGTGVYISNVHYLNYSDRAAARVTGMTRFACFWVEDGAIVAPIAVMRFDDSLLRIFGDGLLALTSEPQLAPSTHTYGARELSSVSAPGALVQGFRLTL